MPYVFLLTLALLLAPQLAAGAQWRIDPEKSAVSFTATQNGAPATGSFAAFSGAVSFDPDKPENAHARVEVDTASVNAPYSEVADMLKTAPWLDTAHFPRAAFESNTFRKTAEGAYEAKGSLTIRDKALPAVFPFTFTCDDSGRAVVEGKLQLDRSAYGVGQGEWQGTDTVKNEVIVSVHLEAEEIR